MHHTEPHTDTQRQCPSPNVASRIPVHAYACARAFPPVLSLPGVELDTHDGRIVVKGVHEFAQRAKGGLRVGDVLLEIGNIRIFGYENSTSCQV